MAMVSKAEMASEAQRIDELLAEVAKDHTTENGPDHITVNWPRNGWACKVCDPDLFEEN